ncbi:MAG: 2-C-methyl-D-erythritol 4-phosphate cytidylyltransferase [Dehalococcoidia bacterium]|nr:2-C-methyl-D-erythritol 4-phosphate cytidylyltransferase [Dehalococcoidia bacterium]
MDGRDKLFIPILGKPLLLYCLEAFERSRHVGSIAVATASESVTRVREIALEHGISKLVAVVHGGARRQDSVSNALTALGQVDIVIVHDGARPFVDDEIIARAVDEAHSCGAASAAVPVKDTIKVATPEMTVASTPDRDTLWAAQTPQSFSLDLLKEAHSRIKHDVTDDAAMVEALGRTVKLFMGSHDNIKVTTPEDITVAEAIARVRLETSPR